MPNEFETGINNKASSLEAVVNLENSIINGGEVPQDRVDKVLGFKNLTESGQIVMESLEDETSGSNSQDDTEVLRAAALQQKLRDKQRKLINLGETAATNGWPEDRILQARAAIEAEFANSNI